MCRPLFCCCVFAKSTKNHYLVTVTLKLYAMKKLLYLVAASCILSSCSSMHVSGKATVSSWEWGDCAYLVSDAEVLLVHKQDTLRTNTDELGRFDFGQVKYRSYFVDGRHPQLGVAELRAVNRMRMRSRTRTPLLNFKFARVVPGLFAPDTLDLYSGGPKRYTYTCEEMEAYNRRRMPRWVVVGYVFDARTDGGVIPKTLSQAKVYVANQRDTVCVNTDRWGRYAVWGMRGDECHVWAECEGYHPSRPRRVRGDVMYATMTIEQARQLVRVDEKKLCMRTVHQFEPIFLRPIRE